MGARGPVPKSITDPVLADAEGDTGHRSDQPTAITALVPEAPRKPSDLPTIESSQWDALVGVLEPTGMLTAADGLTLEMAVRHYGIARMAAQELAYQGSTEHDTVHGGVKKTPAHQVFKDHSELYLKYANQLGLSFVSRARTPAPATGGDYDAESPFD